MKKIVLVLALISSFGLVASDGNKLFSKVMANPSVSAFIAVTSIGGLAQFAKPNNKWARILSPVHFGKKAHFGFNPQTENKDASQLERFLNKGFSVGIPGVISANLNTFWASVAGVTGVGYLALKALESFNGSPSRR
jgi:hypothetical protein